jgi:signal transduction histidine kinase/ActR/RegA family two-component response regulator
MSKDVLLIEDDPIFRRTVIWRLGERDFRIVEAASVADAIERIESNPWIRVLILDMELGSDSGIEVLDHIRQRSEDYRVIILTGHSELLMAEAARRYDIFTYLPKSEGFGESLRFSIDQAFADLERQTLDRKMGMLIEIQRGINQGRELGETLDQICEAVWVVAGAYTCHIRVYDTRAGDYEIRGYAGAAALRPAFDQRRKKGDQFSGRVVESGTDERFDDLRTFNELAGLVRDATSESQSRYFETVRSAYITPIRTGLYGSNVDAVLSVSSKMLNYFDDERSALVREFAEQAALAITKDWLQRRREELQYRYDALGAMLAAISDRLEVNDVEHLSAIVTGHVARIIGAEIVSVFLYDPEHEVLRNVVDLRGDTLAKSDEEYASGQDLTGSVFKDSESVMLSDSAHDASADPRFDYERRNVFLGNIPSDRVAHFIGVPIRIGGEVRGVLRAINKKSLYYDPASARTNSLALLERGFVPDDQLIVEIAANHLGVVIHNAELLHDKNHQVEQTRTLSAVAHIINSETDIDEVLTLTIRNAAEVMQAEICLLFLLDGDHLVLKESFGIPRSLIEGASYKLAEGIVGGVAVSGKPVLVRRAASSDGKYDAAIREYLRDKHGSEEIASLMVVPVATRQRVIGAMQVINKLDKNGAYTEVDLALFRTFADYVAVAIDNAQVYEHQNERLAVAERNAALSKVVQAVAHEISNTVGIIPVIVDSIRAELHAPGAHVIMMLSQLQSIAEQGADFANGIAGFSSGRVGEKQSFDINEVIKETIRELALTLDRYDGKLELSLSRRPIVCDIHLAPFKQIIRNVVVNAFQALDGTRPGIVRIKTDTSRLRSFDLAEVVVEDNGIGIRREHLSRIFEPDFTTKPTGNGLGLWLVRTQLQMLRGSIDVESEVGRGSRFIIRLPRSEHSRERP